MIRVSIVADTRQRASALAELLAEDERLDVLEPGAASSFAEVVVAAGVSADQLPADINAVFLSDEEPATFETPGRAWLPPNATAAELASAVIAAAQDLTVLTDSQARRLLPGRQERANDRENFVESLTNRETQVLRMLSNGFGNKEIAAQLHISDHTAKFHVSQILAKLGAGSRTEAVTIAIRRGLVPI